MRREGGWGCSNRVIAVFLVIVCIKLSRLFIFSKQTTNFAVCEQPNNCFSQDCCSVNPLNVSSFTVTFYYKFRLTLHKSDIFITLTSHYSFFTFTLRSSHFYITLTFIFYLSFTFNLLSSSYWFSKVFITLSSSSLFSFHFDLETYVLFSIRHFHIFLWGVLWDSVHSFVLD